MATFAHVMPWSEEEYLALGETVDKVELFDGTLIVSPGRTPPHQLTSANLASLLCLAARTAGLQVHAAINVRLRPRRIVIPDLVVSTPIDLDQLVTDAASVVLVCEVTSPITATPAPAPGPPAR